MSKPSDQDLKRIIEDAEYLVMGHNWRHVKTGTEYRVLRIALREEDLTPLVIYYKPGIPSGPIFARPMPEFLDGRYQELK